LSFTSIRVSGVVLRVATEASAIMGSTFRDFGHDRLVGRHIVAVIGVVSVVVGRSNTAGRTICVIVALTAFTPPAATAAALSQLQDV
jgi:hypothetical protein